MATKKGRQTPTARAVQPYKKSRVKEAEELYTSSGRALIPWQKNILKDIMATDSAGLWVHQKFGYSVPRRNGKNEIIAAREFWGLVNGEKICHTAHRISTSRAAWLRLCKILSDAGYAELGRPKKNEIPPVKSYRPVRQNGLEQIKMTNGGEIAFRTRSASGGLGEGFDLLIIDEAQEYTEDQEGALVYTVTDSKNPQTIFTGTPPTATSAGTVFSKMRDDVLSGKTYAAGWAEWSIPEYTENINDKTLWYTSNPSMGYHLDERKIKSEVRGDKLDFNIQRLGVWIKYNLASAITAAEWGALKIADGTLKTQGGYYIGVKYSKDGKNVAVGLAVKTTDEHIFVESLGCKPAKLGAAWIIELLQKLNPEFVAVDGASGQEILASEMRRAKMRPPKLPTVKEIITAYSVFENGIYNDVIRHAGQPGLAAVATNCDKRNIGTGGGWGYKALKEGDEVAILDGVVIAYWLCSEGAKKRRQKVTY